MDVLCAYGFPPQYSLQGTSRCCFILNVDWSALTNRGAAQFRGLIRDHNDNLCKGYYGSIGYANILPPEIMALFQVIHLCWEVGFILHWTVQLQHTFR